METTEIIVVELDKPGGIPISAPKIFRGRGAEKNADQYYCELLHAQYFDAGSYEMACK
jgi:hypothetical protein